MIIKKLLIYLFITLSLTLIYSCGGNENDDDEFGEGITNSIIVSTNNFNIVLAEENEPQDGFIFTATSNNGVNITEFCTFYVDGVQIESNTFIPSELAQHQIIAKYEDLESTPITVNVVDISFTYYRHKVLIEDFTGTWCGWCTRIMHAIELVEAQSENAIAVAIHNNDEFDFPGRVPLEDFLQIQGAYPFASLNRTTIWRPMQHQNIGQPISLIEPMSPVGIKINSDLGATNGTVDINFSFKEDISGNLKYMVYILENGLIADQKNYYNNLYGGATTLPNFVHNHVLIGIHGNILGNSINQPAIKDGEIVISNLPVLYKSSNIDNLKVVVFIMKEDGTVLNTQIADGNYLKDYEFAQ